MGTVLQTRAKDDQFIEKILADGREQTRDSVSFLLCGTLLWGCSQSGMCSVCVLHDNAVFAIIVGRTNLGRIFAGVCTNRS